MTKPTLSIITDLAKQSGAILREFYQQDIVVRLKGEIDLVTEVDFKSEEFLLGEIRRIFPSHSIYAEESGQHNGSDEHLWFIDPLDGTVNYAHGVPMFCVSIAYAYQGKVALGAVYDPLRDEMFQAERGSGAWLNQRRLRVSQAEELSQSLLVTGFPYDSWHTPNNNFEHFVRFAKRTQGVRRLGSAALDAAYVGAGRFDGYWELSLKPYDVAAGGLIAEEAGAVVTNLQGGEDYIQPPQSIVAANPVLHQKILAVLAEKG